MAISQLLPVWLTEIPTLYQKHEEVEQLLTTLVIKHDAEEFYTLRDGLIRYKGRLWLPSDVEFTNKIIEEFHASPVAGHSGIRITLSKLKKLFYWEGMKQQVHKWVQECSVCERTRCRLDVG